MISPAWTELQLAIGGTLRLACGDRRGLGLFDTSIGGFWRSFRAAIIVYPLFLFLLWLRVAPAQWERVGAGRIFVVETISYLIAWTAFPLLILRLARWLNWEQRFFAFMVPYNWSQIPQTALMAIVAVERVAGIFPAGAGHTAELVATIAVLVYEWYIARVALAVTGAQATLVVLIDLLLGTVLGRVAQILYNPGALFG